MEIDLTMILAALALLGTIYTYFAHDAKLKKQERLLNHYYLENIEADRTELRKSKIRLELTDMEKGMRKIRVANVGKSKAINVNVVFVDMTEIYGISNPFPIDFLNPEDYCSISFHLSTDSPDRIKLVITWTDDFKEFNKEEQIVFLDG